MRILGLEQFPEELQEEYPGGSVRQLGAASGSRKLYAAIDTLAPGAQGSKFHAHTAQEEFFLVLKGEGTLRTRDGERRVKAGDFFAKPCGVENAHCFVNTGTGPMEILDVGTVETGDVCIYPDEDAYYLRDQGLVFRGRDQVRGWTSEPEGDE